MNLSAVLKAGGFRSEVVAADEELIQTRWKDEARVVLGFSTTSALATRYIELNRRLKAQRSDVVSVFGGAHPTFFPDMIEEEGVDGVCIGEGEQAMLELVAAMDEGRSPREIENWWIKEDGVVHRNPLRPLIQDLDELPLPDRDTCTEGLSVPRIQAVVMTGRGCPHGCTYCYNHVYQRLYAGKGQLVRRRSVEHVMKELRTLKEQGYRFIRFMDDLFTLQAEWVHEFAPRYAGEIGLPFSCLVRANYVTEPVIADLKRAGCHRIMMGIEAGNTRLRHEVLNRRMSDEQILEAARIIRQSGIRLVTANILALPGGTLADDWETVELNIRARTNYGSAALLHPFPGTAIHETARAMGLLQEDHVAAVSAGGFGFSSTLKISDPRERRRVENLHKFFPIVIWFPWLKPLIRRLIELPPNRLFEVLYTASVNFGIHCISMPPGIGGPLLLKRLARRLVRAGRPRPRKPRVADA
jgi:radical SAM superfamily enzyme YgiQ (UPF0313 family)